jgi:hypothetical protein
MDAPDDSIVARETDLVVGYSCEFDADFNQQSHSVGEAHGFFRSFLAFCKAPGEVRKESGSLWVIYCTAS